MTFRSHVIYESLKSRFSSREIFESEFLGIVSKNFSWDLNEFSRLLRIQRSATLRLHNYCNRFSHSVFSSTICIDNATRGHERCARDKRKTLHCKPVRWPTSSGRAQNNFKCSRGWILMADRSRFSGSTSLIRVDWSLTISQSRWTSDRQNIPRFSLSLNFFFIFDDLQANTNYRQARLLMKDNCPNIFHRGWRLKWLKIGSKHRLLATSNASFTKKSLPRPIVNREISSRP